MKAKVSKKVSSCQETLDRDYVRRVVFAVDRTWVDCRRHGLITAWVEDSEGNRIDTRGPFNPSKVTIKANHVPEVAGLGRTIVEFLDGAMKLMVGSAIPHNCCLEGCGTQPDLDGNHITTWRVVKAS